MNSPLPNDPQATDADSAGSLAHANLPARAAESGGQTGDPGAQAEAQWSCAEIVVRVLNAEQERVRLLYERLEHLLHIAVDSPEIPVRKMIATELLKLGGPGEAIVRRACRAADPELRRSAAYALGSDISADINHEFKNGDAEVRTALCRAIVERGRSWDIDLIGEALRAGDAPLQLEALKGIRVFLSQDLEFDDEGRAGCPRDLRQPKNQALLFSTSLCLDSADPSVRIMAASVLADLGPAAGLNFLLALDARHTDARDAARAGFFAGPLPAGSSFDYGIQNGDRQVRMTAARALTVLAGDAARREAATGREPYLAFLGSAVSRLERLVSDYSDEVRIEAFKGLGAAGRSAASALPALRKTALSAERWKLRENSRDAAEKIDEAIVAHALRVQESEQRAEVQ